MNNRFFIVVLAALMSGIVCFGKVQPEKRTQLHNDLMELIEVSKQQSGFDSLKDVELTTGVWNCKLQLDGFLPVVKTEDNNPIEPSQVLAESVTPGAKKAIDVLVAKGLAGYEMKDSDRDRSIIFDKAKYSRKVIFTKREQFVLSRVSVFFKAHQFESVNILVEAFPIVHPKVH